MSDQGFTYSVDIVLCIDATGSMAPIIDQAKHAALSFHEDLGRLLDELGKHVDHLRARVLAFRDFNVDGDALEVSNFFSLPEEATGYASFINGIDPHGGGDEPESGCEALVAAMMSPWTTSGTKKRQIIALWTDASAHPIEEAPAAAQSELGGEMPHTFDELAEMWDNSQHMSPQAKRLLLYAPDAYPWTDIGNNWENTLHHPSRSGEGLDDTNYGTILDSIARSV